MLLPSTKSMLPERATCCRTTYEQHAGQHVAWCKRGLSPPVGFRPNIRHRNLLLLYWTNDLLLHSVECRVDHQRILIVIPKCIAFRCLLNVLCLLTYWNFQSPGGKPGISSHRRVVVYKAGDDYQPNRCLFTRDLRIGNFRSNRITNLIGRLRFEFESNLESNQGIVVYV